MLCCRVEVVPSNSTSAQREEENQPSVSLSLLFLFSTKRKLECVKLVATDVDKWMTPGLHREIVLFILVQI